MLSSRKFNVKDDDSRSRNLVNLSLNVCCRCWHYTLDAKMCLTQQCTHAHKNIFYFFLFFVCVCVCVSSLIRICFGLVQQLSMARRVRFIIFFFLFLSVFIFTSTWHYNSHIQVARTIGGHTHPILFFVFRFCSLTMSHTSHIHSTVHTTDVFSICR